MRDSRGYGSNKKSKRFRDYRCSWPIAMFSLPAGNVWEDLNVWNGSRTLWPCDSAVMSAENVRRRHDFGLTEKPGSRVFGSSLFLIAVGWNPWPKVTSWTSQKPSQKLSRVVLFPPKRCSCRLWTHFAKLSEIPKGNKPWDPHDFDATLDSRFGYLFCFSRPKPRGFCFLLIMTLSGPATWASAEELEELFN